MSWGVQELAWSWPPKMPLSCAATATAAELLCASNSTTASTSLTYAPAVPGSAAVASVCARDSQSLQSRAHARRAPERHGAAQAQQEYCCIRMRVTKTAARSLVVSSMIIAMHDMRSHSSVESGEETRRCPGAVAVAS